MSPFDPLLSASRLCNNCWSSQLMFLSVFSPLETNRTRPSILCVTHEMIRKKRNYSVGWTVPHEMMNIRGTWWHWVSISWYRVQGQQRACMPALHILEKVEIWSGVTDAWHTHSLTYSQTTEYRATQLVYSIKFKLSHATITSPRVDDMHAVWFWCVKSSHMILTSGKEYRGHTHFKRLLLKM